MVEGQSVFRPDVGDRYSLRGLKLHWDRIMRRLAVGIHAGRALLRSGTLARALRSPVLPIGFFCILLFSAAPLARAEDRTAPLLGGTALSLSSTAVALISFAEGSCTGVLVAPSLILTTSHCIVDDAGVPFTKQEVIVGSTTRSVVRGYVHPMYVPWDSVEASVPFDIGVLELSAPVTSVAPIPVLQGFPLARGSLLTVYGYGFNETSDVSATILDDGRVAMVKVNTVQEGSMTAEHVSSGASICAGDSGGPAVYSAGAIVAVAGISVAGTNFEVFGRCILAGRGQSIFTNLQSAAARSFLAEFPEIARIDGARLQLLSGVQQVATAITAAYYERSLSKLRRKVESAGKTLQRLSKPTDKSAFPFLWAASYELTAARKERKTAAARQRIVNALTHLATVLSLPVDGS